MCHPAVSIHTLFKQDCKGLRATEETPPDSFLFSRNSSRKQKREQAEPAPPADLTGGPACIKVPAVTAARGGQEGLLGLGHAQHLLFAPAR